MAFKTDSLVEAVMERLTVMFSSDVGWVQRLWRSSPVDLLRRCLELIEGEGRDGAGVSLSKKLDGA